MTFEEVWTSKQQGRVRLTALRILKNKQDAEDVMQDVGLRVYQYLHTFQGKSQASTWIHTIARNRALEVLRNRRMVEVPLTGEDGHMLLPISDRGHAAVEARNALSRVLRRMSPRLQRVLSDHYLLGKTCAQIAMEQGTTIGSVKSELSRAVYRKGDHEVQWCSQCARVLAAAGSERCELCEVRE